MAAERDTRSALIVGAGIGGLAAAIALRRAGWQVRVLERAASPRELGFALNLAPNAMAALAELGLADAVAAQGHAPRVFELRRADGRMLRQLDIGAHMAARGVRSLFALRPALHGALLDAVGADALALGSEATAFESARDAVTVTLAGGRTLSAGILVGADGVGSMVRAQLHPRERPPRQSPYCALRGVAQIAGGLGDLSGVGYLAPGMEAAIARAGRSAVYWYVSMLAVDVPPQLSKPDAIAQHCSARLDDLFRAVVRATQPADLRFDVLMDREPIDVWGRGRVTLLGDAAHPMLPHAGQGAAQALEDAVALGLALAPTRDPATSLRRYEMVRIVRTRRIVALARRIAATTTTRNPVVARLRTAALRYAPASALLAALYPASGADPHRELRTAQP